MKKILTLIGIFGLTLIQAQVGINTDDPDASADLELGSNNKALLLNRVTDVSTISNPKEGMLVFDVSAAYGCLRVYQKSGWTGCFTSGATENTTASITDKTEIWEIYANGLVNDKINNTTDVFTIKIPYTNASGSYDRVSVTTMAAPGEGGDTNTLTLTIPGGTFSTNGELTATIKVGGADEEYLVSKTFGDVNTIATFPIMMNGISFKVVLKSRAGIRDRNFGDGNHDFIYLPVEVNGTHNVNGQPYKKTWLNMNLGAEYANVNSPDFNPTVNKTGTAAHSDSKIYGSYFQWQRKADGHEFINSNTTTDLATSWTDSGSWDGKFITTSDYNWVSNGSSATGSDLQFWQINGANNPCPDGYRIPTNTEWLDLHEAVTGSRNNASGSDFLNQTILPNLAAAGYRDHSDGLPKYMGKFGDYWSSYESSSSNDYAWDLFFYNYSSGPGTEGIRSYGFIARCIKDEN